MVPPVRFENWGPRRKDLLLKVGKEVDPLLSNSVDQGLSYPLYFSSSLLEGLKGWKPSVFTRGYIGLNKK